MRDFRTTNTMQTPEGELPLELQGDAGATASSHSGSNGCMSHCPSADFAALANLSRISTSRNDGPAQGVSNFRTG